MNFLVTGGAGFIGSTFTQMLLDGEFDERPNKVIVLDALTYAGSMENLESCFPYSNFEFVHGSICDRKLVKRLVDSTDFIINFAAESHVDRSIDSASEFVLTNIAGVEVLLSAIKEKKKKLIQVSTDEVYGTIEEGTWDEEYPLKPNSPYSASKAAADLLCLSFHKTHGIDVRITRCCNNYGPRQFPEKVIPVFINQLLSGEKVKIYGNGNNIREWVHVRDHCEGIWAVIRNGMAGEIYNIGSDLELNNKELASILISELGFLIEEKISFVEDRLGHDFRYSLNSNKIRKELGFNPMVDFHEGLRETINWYKDRFESGSR